MFKHLVGKTKIQRLFSVNVLPGVESRLVLFGLMILGSLCVPPKGGVITNFVGGFAKTAFS